MSVETQFDTFDDVLEHYGIKGMKWGVRRTDEQLARARGERSKKKKKGSGKLTETPENMRSKDAKEVQKAKDKIRKDDTTALTNDELKEVIKRMNLEKQYSDLNKKDAEQKKKEGEAYIKKMQQRKKTLDDILKFANSEQGKWLAQIIRASLSQVSPIDFSGMRI